LTAGVPALRGTKMQRLLPSLRLSLPHVQRDGKFDFLTAKPRQRGAIVDTPNVSAHPYSPSGVAMIDRYAEGLVLDCGAGMRDVYHDNAVNYEIVDYDTTDIVGLGESLPLNDAAFDAVISVVVISVAVLGHVRDPFACAAEIIRVLKPGGELVCSVPVLQPLHGFPPITITM
jgi:SAM-dependent methyltransferase